MKLKDKLKQHHGCNAELIRYGDLDGGDKYQIQIKEYTALSKETMFQLMDAKLFRHEDPFGLTILSRDPCDALGLAANIWYAVAEKVLGAPVEQCPKCEVKDKDTVNLWWSFGNSISFNYIQEKIARPVFESLRNFLEIPFVFAGLGRFGIHVATDSTEHRDNPLANALRARIREEYGPRDE